MRFSNVDDWKVIKLSEYADFLQGLTYHPENVKHSGTLVLRSSNIQNGKLDFNDCVYVDMVIPKRISTRKNDVLMCVRNGSKALVGKTAIIDDQNENHAWGAFMSVLRPKDNSTFLFHYLNSKYFTNQIKADLNTATVNQITFGMLNHCNISIPLNQIEKNKICDLLDKINLRIDTQNKIIRDLKVLIKRFLDFDYKTNTSEYEDVLLSSILTESKILNINNNEVYSVAVEDGVVNQVEHLGRSFAAKDTSNYHVAKYGDIIYTKSPTGSFPYGIVKQSFIKNDVAVSPLYGIYHPNSYEIGYYIHHYFLYAINCNNYLHPLVNKGAKNTMNITNTRFLEGKILVPNNNERVINIHHFLHVLNKKLQNEIAINNKLLDQKAFLLKNLFI